MRVCVERHKFHNIKCTQLLICGNIKKTSQHQYRPFSMIIRYTENTCSHDNPMKNVFHKVMMILAFIYGTVGNWLYSVYYAKIGIFYL